ncbi:MAG: hypothetical protein P4M00_21515 [Azospirillaceae bacterium]|nr:hypothetical protein [Azospirillaceae bacterium]
MSSTIGQTGFATLQSLATSYLAQASSSGAAAVASTAPNPYGTLSEKYQLELAQDSVVRTSIDLNKLSTTGDVSAQAVAHTGAAVAVAQAFKNATQVDPATGLLELQQSGIGALTQALYTLASGDTGSIDQASSADKYSELSYENSTPRTEASGALSNADIAAAVKSAVAAAMTGSAEHGLSLSLTTVTEWGGAGQDTSGGQNAGACEESETLDLSITATGQFVETAEGKYHGVSERDDTIQGTAKSPLLDPTLSFLGTPIETDLYSYRGNDYNYSTQPGVEQTEFGLESESIKYTNTYTAPVTGTQSVFSATLSGFSHSVLQENQNGARDLTPKSQNQSSAYDSAMAALQMIKAAQLSDAEMNKDIAALSKNRTASQSTAAASLSLPARVTDHNGQTSMLYRRPDGSLGRFVAPAVNTTA